jgi:transcriptional regulator with XRE-family HTH domain
MNPNERLRQARKGLGKSEAEVADAMGISLSNYYDLEYCAEELPTVMTMKQLRNLSALLGITVRSLLGAERDQSIAFVDLAEIIRKYLAANRITASEFEDRAGWELRGVLEDPEAAWNWTIVCLQDVCETLGIAWQDVLPV